MNDKKANNLIADTEKVWVVWIEDPTSQNIPLSQSLTQSKGLTLFNLTMDKRDEDAAEVLS